MFRDYIEFWKNLFITVPFRIFDYFIILIFSLYVFEDISFGLIASLISFISTIASFFIGLALYPHVSGFLSGIFNLPKGLADAISFLVVAAAGFILVSMILSLLRKKYVDINFPNAVDKIGGAIFGTLSFFFIASFAVSLLLSFPTSSVIRSSIRESIFGGFLASNTQGIDRSVRQIFGGAIEDTINFLTVKPDSEESISLNFKTSTAKPDAASEAEMLELVNKERIKHNLPPMQADFSLSEVARGHAKDMLERGYFSHYTPEGLSPFDRMGEANISYQFAGENLAFAPDTVIAMQGLMKSPGHRANILNSNFTKAGIGVLDAGIYGKMFVQEFSD